MIVVDASVILRACLSKTGFKELGDRQLVAPPLLWSEVPSSLHQLLWRQDVPPRLIEPALERFLDAEIERSGSPGLIREAWSVAERLGWAKTYDAEYVALAESLGCRLLTIDVRLQRGAARLVDVIGPADL